MSKIPVKCKVLSKLAFPTTSNILFGCNLGLRPSWKCRERECEYYDGEGIGARWWENKNDK